MMKTLAILATLVFLASGMSYADDSDDTLRFYLSKSDMVVLGVITSEPVGIILSDGAPNYICEFKVNDVLKGQADLKGKTIKVNIMRFEMDKKDRHPLIKKDSKCILFLKQQSKGTVPRWVTADVWFGIQHPIPWMAKSLKRLANQEKENVEQTDASDDTLTFCLSKSDMVVLGVITSEPVGIIHSLGVPNYICAFKVDDVLKGQADLKGKTIKVNIMRFEMDKKDRHPLIKKDSKCILFLKQQSKGTVPRWVTADVWFGIQHPIPWMAKSLNRKHLEHVKALDTKLDRREAAENALKKKTDLHDLVANRLEIARKENDRLKTVNRRLADRLNEAQAEAARLDKVCRVLREQLARTRGAGREASGRDQATQEGPQGRHGPR